LKKTSVFDTSTAPVIPVIKSSNNDRYFNTVKVPEKAKAVQINSKSAVKLAVKKLLNKS